MTSSWMYSRYLSRLSITFLALFIGILTLQTLHNGKSTQFVASIAAPIADRFNRIQKHREPRVHLLVPGNRANHKICRVLLAAIVNDYPPPVIINWGLNEGDDAMNGYDMTTGKNWGVLKYLWELPPEADNDLVIMIDAHDVTFQLPLDILLQRYTAANEKVATRLQEQHGADSVLKHRLAQTIIMPAEKYCWPWDHRHPACYAVPESELRPDAYGQATDQKTETNRPRWLNSGVIMGPVDDMRVMYEWAHTLWKAYDTVYGDQDYFSNIYGRQELSRHRLRGSKEWAFGFGEHFEEDELVKPHMETGHTDYHLGLDLLGDLFQALNSASTDLSSVVHSNETDVLAKDHEHGTADIYQTPFPFPDDLLKTPLPVGSRRENAAGAAWHDVRLFSNFHARTIPAVLHHNGDKSKMDDWWRRQWWTGHGREMLRLRTSNPAFGIKTDANSTIFRWEDICGQFENEVFVDPVEPYE